MQKLEFSSAISIFQKLSQAGLSETVGFHVASVAVTFTWDNTEEVITVCTLECWCLPEYLCVCVIGMWPIHVIYYLMGTAASWHLVVLLCRVEVFLVRLLKVENDPQNSLSIACWIVAYSKTVCSILSQFTFYPKWWFFFFCYCAYCAFM